MVIKRTAESLQKADFTNIGSQPEDAGETASAQHQRMFNYRKILRELAPTDCGFGSVVPVALSPANQLCNSTLQCKRKILIPTVFKGVFWFGGFFFLNPQLVTEVKYCHGSYSAVASSGENKNACVWLIHPSSTCRAQLFPKRRNLGPFKTLKK